MMGEEGESQDIELKNKGGGYFNRGQLDRFRIRAKDVGRVSEFYLRGRGFTPLIWLYSTYGYDVLAVWSQMGYRVWPLFLEEACLSSLSIRPSRKRSSQYL